MKDEWLPVVNMHDRIIDHRPRHEIHALGLRHRAVHVMVFNTAGQLFLQKRSWQKDLNRGLWDTSAAGHVDQGEDYPDCAVRETHEELGIDITGTLAPLFKLSATPELGMEFIQVFRCSHNGPFQLAPSEIDAGLWSSIPDITRRVKEDDQTMTRTLKCIWRRYQTALGSDQSSRSPHTIA